MRYTSFSRMIAPAAVAYLAAMASPACANDTPHVFFKSPTNGAIVSSPFKVEMGVAGMEVSPAGELKPEHGHHHLLIDGAAVTTGEVVPTDSTHLHFGKGQTETELTLPPGKHKLTLQFADGAHRSYGEGLSSTIEVIVK